VAGRYTFPDANGNGISDLWETEFFGAVLGANAAPEFDSDGDGASNLAEFLAGTDPVSAASVLRLHPPRADPNAPVRVSWDTVPGHEYRMEISNDLRNWMQSPPVLGNGLPLTNTVPALLGAGQYYFRVRVFP
jgi:hypothetical protein